jgi:hypothetical protein
MVFTLQCKRKKQVKDLNRPKQLFRHNYTFHSYFYRTDIQIALEEVSCVPASGFIVVGKLWRSILMPGVNNYGQLGARALV